MLKLLGKDNCPTCTQSKNLLNQYNVEYEFVNIMEDVEKWMSIMDRFNIKSAGVFLYDDEKDDVIKVTEYIDNLSKS